MLNFKSMVEQKGGDSWCLMMVSDVGEKSSAWLIKVMAAVFFCFRYFNVVSGFCR